MYKIAPIGKCSLLHRAKHKMTIWTKLLTYGMFLCFISFIFKNSEKQHE